MTGITAQRRSNLPMPDLYGGGTVDLEEQRAIMAQIERERAASAASAAAGAEEPASTPRRTPQRTRNGPPPPSRRRSRSLERPSLPTPTAFAGMAEASAADSPGIVRNSSSNYDDDGHDQSYEGEDSAQPYFGRWDSDKTDGSDDVRRRIVPDQSNEDSEGDVEPYLGRFESDNTYGSDATFGAAEFADQLTALERKPNVAEAAARMGKPTHHRQHLSVPVSGFSSSRPDVRERSVRFHESSSGAALEEEQKAILREIERQRRLEREEKEEQRASQHRQHKSMPAALDFDDSAVEEQMAIMREIERQQRQQKQEKQRRDEEEERRRQQQEEPQRPTHRSAKTLPADHAFLGGTSLDEQRAIMERIEREQRKGQEQPTHRATKSFPDPSASSWDRKSSSSAQPDDMAAAKLRYRPSSSSSSSRSPGFRGNAAAQRLDERIKRKSDQFGGSGSFSSSPPRVETAGTASSPVGAHESFSSSSNSPTKQKGSSKKKDEGKVKKGIFTRPSSSSSSAATARTSSSSASSSGSTLNSSSSSTASAAASSSADPEEPTYVSGRHRVVLVDGRDAVARSGGTKKVVTCAGCSKRLTVSRTCEVVFCPKCETLTPAALSTEVGAWGEGM